MKVILYMATSLSGHITRGEDDSDWVSEVDWKEFNKLKEESRVIVMGSRTFLQFENDFPQKDALNVVMTHDPKLLSKQINGSLFTDQKPHEVIKTLEDKGYTQTMLIGGMRLNTSFLKENLIDEIWIDVHPILIGQGKTILEPLDLFKKLILIEQKELDEGQVLLKYKLE